MGDACPSRRPAPHDELIARFVAAHPWPNDEAEFRLRHKDGSWRCIRAQGEAITDRTGRAVRMIGGNTDITEQKRAELETMRVNRALRMLSESNHALLRIEDERVSDEETADPEGGRLPRARECHAPDTGSLSVAQLTF